MDSFTPLEWIRADRHRAAWSAVTDAHPDARPAKRLRPASSHASLLQQSVSQLVRDPWSTLSSIGITLPSRPRHPKTHPVPTSSTLPPEEQERQLQLANLKTADSLEKWETAAARLDVLEGNDAWKLDDVSDDYDWQLVNVRLNRLEACLAAHDLNAIAELLRTELTRDLGGMGHADLYRRSRIGTKALIERYNDSVIDALNTLVRASGERPGPSLDPRQMQEQIKHTRQSFGRSALLLSGGATFGMVHVGVVKSLLDANVLPRIISGASAGSIVAAVVCAKTDAEVPDVLANFCDGPLDVFEQLDSDDPDAFPIRLLKRFAATGAIYDSDNLTRVMRDYLGDMTFQEAYNRTRRILNICVSTPDVHDMPRLLNYITSPHVVIWSAVAASCAVPLIFSAASLHVKHPTTGEITTSAELGGKLIDGSVDNDVPTVRLAEMLNVNHFIVSQVNPHVVPFLSKHEDEYQAAKVPSPLDPPSGRTWTHVAASLAKGEALHRLDMLAMVPSLSDVMTKMGSVLGQRYSGDITILPDISYSHFPWLLANPSEKFLKEAILCGERATWPKLSRIRNHVAVEQALDRAVQESITRLAFSPSQIDVRLGIFTDSAQAQQVRRRGSRASHQSAQSVIATRPVSAPRGGHNRSNRSFLESAPVPIVVKVSQNTEKHSPKTKGASPHSTSSMSSDEEGDGETSPTSITETKHSPFFGSRSQPATPAVGMRSFRFGPKSRSPSRTRGSLMPLKTSDRESKSPPLLSPTEKTEQFTPLRRLIPNKMMRSRSSRRTSAEPEEGKRVLS